jgi:hypothetical protein
MILIVTIVTTWQLSGWTHVFSMGAQTKTAQFVVISGNGMCHSQSRDPKILENFESNHARGNPDVNVSPNSIP